MFATAAQEKRLCLDCNIVDISDRARNARLCESCLEIREKERAKNYYLANRERVLARVTRYQQTSEAKQKRQEWEKSNPERFLVYRQRQKQKYREKTGYNPEGRTCAKCGNGISSDRGHNAEWCKSCSTPQARKCKECKKVISDRGPRAKFCDNNNECKQRYQQRKELEGYTKTCKKCNKEKQHTEFGMHSKFRRSVCKICEASTTREYYQTLPVEERQRRRRIQGHRERDKEANLPPEEKAMLRAKRLKARRQKVYGSDFDEDRLYSEQEGRCAICGRLKSLELDHDHKTNRPRGFLCKNCNLKLLSQYEEKFPPKHQDSRHLNTYLDRGKL